MHRLQDVVEQIAGIIERHQTSSATQGALERKDDLDVDSLDVDLEELRPDELHIELVAFIEQLAPQRQAKLVALAWVGRGCPYEGRDFADAVEYAKEQRLHPSYIAEKVSHINYLRDGMAKIGSWN